MTLEWLDPSEPPYGTPRCRFCDRYLRWDGTRNTYVTWTEDDPLCDNGDDDLSPSHEPEDLALPGGALIAEHLGDEALDTRGGDVHEDQDHRIRADVRIDDRRSGSEGVRRQLEPPLTVRAALDRALRAGRRIVT